MGRRALVILLDNYFPQDPRVSREVKTLSISGTECYVLSRWKPGHSRREFLKQGLVERVSFPGMEEGGKPFAILYYVFYRFTIIPRLIKIIKDWRPDVVHVHDLPGSLPSLMAAKLFGLPVIVDLHEDWPDLVILNSKKRGILSQMLATAVATLLRVEERIVLWAADAIITVVEELADEFVRRGADRSKVVVVHNAVDLEEMDQEVGDLRDSEERDGERFRIVYVGGIGFHRGLETPVMGMRKLVRELDAELVLVGDGNHVPHLRRLIGRLELDDRVKITGWLPFREAMKYVAEADLCLVPGIRTPETEFSFPNKIQQYMYFSKPIVAADLTSFRRIVGECGCGVLYDPDDPESFAEAVLSARESLVELGIRGRRYLEERLNWRTEAAKLLRLYDALLARRDAR